MNKSDLETGMRVKTREGNIYLVVKDIKSEIYGRQDVAFVSEYGFMEGSGYNEDLKNNNDRDLDIIEVRSIFENDSETFLTSSILMLNRGYSIWKREERKKMTISQIEEALGYPVEIITEGADEN